MDDAEAPRDARLLGRREVGGGLTLVSLEVDGICRVSYQTPGQYAEVTIGDKNGFFALASAAAHAPWELIVRDSGGASHALLHADLGAALHVTPALGTGFDIHRAEGKPAVIAVAGSAISVARPLVAWRVAAGALASTFVFVGARSIAEAPLTDELSAWAAAGARVWLCASRDDAGELAHVTITRNYVQDAITAAVDRGDVPAGAVAFVAGHDAMVSSLVSRLGEAPALASVYTNV
jgi:NAD(P)H-flavin reductase